MNLTLVLRLKALFIVDGGKKTLGLGDADV